MTLDFDPARRARYSQGAGIQRIIPAAVARPVDLGELRAVLAAAAARGLAVTPRGSGTAMDGSNIGAGVVIDMTRFEAGRCEVDPHGRSARTTPSLPLAMLRDAARHHGLRLPPEPSSGAWATAGGMVATNAAGARTVRYGSVRPWIRGITLETSVGPLQLVRGEAPDMTHPVVIRWMRDARPVVERHAAAIIARFPRVAKNSAGYALGAFIASGDLLDLVIGSEGTLGIVTDVIWRLDLVPAHLASLRVSLAQRSQLPDAIAAIREFDPSTLEFLDESFLRVVSLGAMPDDNPGVLDRSRGMLLADFEGDTLDEVAARLDAARVAASVHAAHVTVAHREADIERLWLVRHGASPALAALTDGRRSLQVIEDACVPASSLVAYLDAVDGVCGREGIDVVMFGHAGDGHVHVNLLPNLGDADWRDRVRAIYRDVSAAVIALGGTLSGEHGAGRLRAPLLRAQYGDAVMQCFAAVKHAFDPEFRFNPGVILGSADPFLSLKVGSGATAIEPGAAAWLDALERGALWGTDRWNGSDAPDR